MLLLCKAGTPRSFFFLINKVVLEKLFHTTQIVSCHWTCLSAGAHWQNGIEGMAWGRLLRWGEKTEGKVGRTYYWTYF